jgi:DNA replication protein DnaC
MSEEEKEALKQRVQIIMAKVKKQDLEEKSYSRNANELVNNDFIYKCDKCRDMLFIETEDGSYAPCECRQLRIAEVKLKNSGVSEEFRNMRFENYNYEISMETMEAFLVGKKYFKNFEENKLTRNNSCLFSGQVGAGKTHIAMAIANTLIDNCVGVIFMPYRSIITKIKQLVTTGEEYQKEIQLYKNAPVLLIDDLFKGKVTEADINVIYEIIDYRYFKKLPLIVTTEKTIEQLIDIDEAIGSRLYEMCKANLVALEGRKLNYRIYGA